MPKSYLSFRPIGIAEIHTQNQETKVGGLIFQALI